jgi:arsenate reductase (thioredoxin)
MSLNDNTRTMPVVLFLCSHNAARSQMAEAFLKHYAGDRFEIHSAGLEPTAVHPLTIRVMDEVGIDIRGQQAKGAKLYLGRLAVNYAIFVCPDVEESCPTLWPFGGVRLRWPFDDPAAWESNEQVQLSKFRSIRDQIDRQIRNWLETMDETTTRAEE